MAQPTILLADDDFEFLKSKSELIRHNGYQVVTASSPEDAMSILNNQDIDIAVLDLRLRGGGHEDTSGLDVARSISPRIPKIILTVSSDTDVMRDVVGINSEGIPHIVEWLRKADTSNEVLVERIGKALDLVRKVRRPLFETTVFNLDKDYENARMQSRTNFWIALFASIGGIALIFVGAILSMSEIFAIGILSAVAGVITEAVGILAFRRVDAANTRMDNYHKESLHVKQLEILLDACEELPATQEQTLKISMLDKVASSWFNPRTSTE